MALRSLPLGLRIFLITAVLIAFSVVTAVTVTYLLGNRLAGEHVRQSLESSQAMQAEARQRRFEQLELISQVFTADSPFISYVAEATGGGLEGGATVDRASLLDLLTERQQQLGFEFALLLDPDGRLVVRTDQPGASGQDFSGTTLVDGVLNGFRRQAGFWLEEGRLYQAAAVPLLGPGFDLYGVLITGFGVGDEMAGDIKRITGSDLAFLVADGEQLHVPASTLDVTQSNQLAQMLGADADLRRRVLEEGETVSQLSVELDGRRMISVMPLKDATDEVVGATVALISPAREMAGYQRIQQVTLLAGVLAMGIAMALSYALSRLTLAPVRQLASVAEAAARGDYSREIPVGRSDEVGKLARAFNSLLSDLREKRDIESYVSDLSRYLPEPEVGEALVPPAVHFAALLGVELRRFAQQRGSDPALAIDRLGRDLRRITAAVSARQGKVVSISGHRVMARFDGAGCAVHAVTAAGQLMRALTDGDNAFDEVEPPTAAVVVGEVTSGSVVLGEQPDRVLVGMPVQQLDNLLREATPGDILLSRDVHLELGDSFERAGVELKATPGVLSTQLLYVLNSDLAERVLGATGPLPPRPTSVTQTPIQATLSQLAPGSVLGDRFELLSVLGSGGMGVVYKARDRELNDLVALKTLKRDAWNDRESLERLKSEIKLARRITHPNVLRTFDFGEVAGIAYISMEYVRGLTLRYLLEQAGRLPYSAALRLARQLCAGLEAAHAVGVLHRDIKPENLIIDNAGNAKLMDFGIARPIRRTTAGQTEPGSIIGTPHYLAPEQIEGREPDHRADVYACGIVFYEMFTGKLPFAGDSPMQIVLAHLREEPVLPSAYWTEIPSPLEQLILKAIAREPQDRYPNVGALLAALNELRA